MDFNLHLISPINSQKNIHQRKDSIKDQDETLITLAPFHIILENQHPFPLDAQSIKNDSCGLAQASQNIIDNEFIIMAEQENEYRDSVINTTDQSISSGVIKDSPKINQRIIVNLVSKDKFNFPIQTQALDNDSMVNIKSENLDASQLTDITQISLKKGNYIFQSPIPTVAIANNIIHIQPENDLLHENNLSQPQDLPPENSISIPVSFSTTTSQPTIIQLPPNIPIGSETWNQQLNQHIMFFSRHGISHAQIRLHPEELGILNVHLQVEDNQAVVHFMSQHNHVRTVMEVMMPLLRNSLQESGINLAQSSVGDDSFNTSSNHHSQTDHKHNKSHRIRPHTISIINNEIKHQPTIELKNKYTNLHGSIDTFV